MVLVLLSSLIKICKVRRDFYLPAQLSPVNPRSHTQSPVEVSQDPWAGSVQSSKAEQLPKEMRKYNSARKIISTMPSGHQWPNYFGLGQEIGIARHFNPRFFIVIKWTF